MMPIYYVYMHNKADSRDDEVVKLRASSSLRAQALAADRHAGVRFDVGKASRPKEFRRLHPDWYKLLSSLEAEPFEP